METIDQMRQRHTMEIAELQSKCKHRETIIGPYSWAIGHTMGEVEVCRFCGKILRHLPDAVTSKVTWSGNTYVNLGGRIAPLETLGEDNDAS